MMVQTDTEQLQREVHKESANLSELLAALIIGGIGMGISIAGAVNSDPIFYGLGIAIMVLSAIWIGAKGISEILDLIDRLKNKNTTDISK